MSWLSHGESLAEAARDLVGTPFRAGGRCRKRGVDCIGLVALSLEAAGRTIEPLPRYAMRQSTIEALLPLARAAGLRPAPGIFEAGDVLLLRPSAAQYHLAICNARGGIIHAHAGLGRVVIGGLPAWPVLRSWRLDQ